MIQTDVAIIGGGPAGLCAALSAAAFGAKITLIDNGPRLGGQLIKQTHRFFGANALYAGLRGFEIAERLVREIRSSHRIDILSPATVTGIYEDGVLTVAAERSYRQIKPKRVVVATGASENMIPFQNNDLPGVYGAGAVQTLMNLYGVLPGSRVLIVGAGNIGLIVGYQLLQAGVRVAAIVEAQGRVGGYGVHASKIRRFGVPIYTRHSIQSVNGTEGVEEAVIAAVDQQRRWREGTEKKFQVDTVCLAAGLSPLVDLLWMSGCRMKFVRELGGYVALRDKNLRTTVETIYIAGDAAGIEEAASAMIEGKLAGMSAALSLLPRDPESRVELEEFRFRLARFRDNPIGKKVTRGNPESFPSGGVGSEKMFAKTGVPSHKEIRQCLPTRKRRAAGPVAVIECWERIPCDPCQFLCPQGAIRPFANLNDLPGLDEERCSGCGACISGCPGLAIFVVDEKFSVTEALVRLPYEFRPLPEKGKEVWALDREGKKLCRATVVGRPEKCQPHTRHLPCGSQKPRHESAEFPSCGGIQ